MGHSTRPSGALLQATLDALPDQVAVLDEAGRIVAVNRSWRDFARDNRGDAAGAELGRSYLEVCDRAGREGLQEAATFAEGIRSVLTGDREQYEFEYPCHSDRERRWLQATVRGFAVEGDRHALVAHHDVTALVEANQELEEFAFVAAHDLQEPLRKIVAFGELLPRDLGVPLSPQAATDVRFLVDAARRMNALVRDLLSYAGGNRGGLKLEDVSVGACVDEALESLGLPDGQVAIERASLPRLRASHSLLVQIYRNLLDNALKFAEPGRELRIGLTAEPDDGEWLLGVRDNGSGFDPGQVDQVFQPFTRLHGRQLPGSGIGLAICRKAVERHGGRIWAETRPGQGTHVLFRLPDPTSPSAAGRD